MGDCFRVGGSGVGESICSTQMNKLCGGLKDKGKQCKDCALKNKSSLEGDGCYIPEMIQKYCEVPASLAVGKWKFREFTTYEFGKGNSPRLLWDKSIDSDMKEFKFESLVDFNYGFYSFRLSNDIGFYDNEIYISLCDEVTGCSNGDDIQIHLPYGTIASLNMIVHIRAFENEAALKIGRSCDDQGYELNKYFPIYSGTVDFNVSSYDCGIVDHSDPVDLQKTSCEGRDNEKPCKFSKNTFYNSCGNICKNASTIVEIYKIQFRVN